MSIPDALADELQSDKAEVVFPTRLSYDRMLLLRDIKISARHTLFGSGSEYSDIRFINVHFTGNLTIADFVLNSIHFESCTFGNATYPVSIIFRNIHKKLTLTVEYCTTVGKVDWQCDNIPINRLHIEHSDLKKTTFLLAEKPINAIHITKSFVSQFIATGIGQRNSPASMYMTNTEMEGLVIRDSFFAEFHADNLKFPGTLFFSNNVFQEFVVSFPQAAIDIELKNCEAEKRFAITLGEANAAIEKEHVIRRIVLDDCNLHKDAVIRGNGRELTTVEDMRILGKTETETVLRISDMRVNTMQLLFDRTVNDLYVDRVRVGHLLMHNLRNNGEITFSEMRVPEQDGVWTITASQPKNWKLIDCQLGNLAHMEIQQSDLASMRYASVEWFDAKKLRSRAALDLRKKLSWWQHLFRNLFQRVNSVDVMVQDAANRREVYRMLKEAAENQKDRFQALQFHKDEMRAHSAYLSLRRVAFHPDRIVLWAGNTNMHGLQWWRPVVWGIGFTLLFFAALVYNTDPKMLHKPFFSAAGQEQLWSHWGIIPQMMNPVHALDKMFPEIEDFRGITWLLDYVHRIVMAFFIVQTVAAFRKYMKG